MSRPCLWTPTTPKRTATSRLCSPPSVLPPEGTVVLSDGLVVGPQYLLLEALRCDPSNTSALDILRSILPGDFPWSRARHAWLFGAKINVLFATLFLAFQRLETEGVLPLAHQAMLEDMLESWTWADRLVHG